MGQYHNVKSVVSFVTDFNGLVLTVPLCLNNWLELVGLCLSFINIFKSLSQQQQQAVKVITRAQTEL